MDHDVIIVGGSYAGMEAALQLLRARRKVLVIDAGIRRNRFASHAHGFLTQDGVPPDAIAARAGDTNPHQVPMRKMTELAITPGRTSCHQRRE